VRALGGVDPYEVLEVARGATQDEIERAYRLALETWAEDSLAVYPLLSESEAGALRDRARNAYRVLSDPKSRGAYDASSGDDAEVRPEPPGAGSESPAEPFQDLEDSEEAGGDWSGARLRRVRLRRGLELEDVASITKINPNYLRFIEEERYAELPARVYLRGFVAAYASCVGLDGSSVAAGYLQRWEQARVVPRRRRPW
jgi:curved DNA-binding protein CbpA